MTLLDTLLFTVIVQIFCDKELLSWYNSFTQKRVLKWSFIGDTGVGTLHGHCSGVPGALDSELEE